MTEDTPRDPDFDELQFVKDQCTTLSTHNTRLIREIRGLEKANERLMDDIVKLERHIDQMMGTLGKQAYTIQRMTDERLGPEKSLREQMQERGIMPPQNTALENVAHAMGTKEPDPAAGD